MPGNVRRRGDKWQASVEVPRRNGMRKRIYKTFKSEGDANFWISDRFIAVKSRTFVAPSNATLAVVFKRCQAVRMTGASTNRTYDTYCNRMVSSFGDYAIQAITTDVLEEFVADLRTAERLDGRLGGLSPRTIDHNIRQVKSFFAWAKERKYIDEDPAENLKRIRRPGSRDMVILTVAETKAMFAVVVGSPLEPGAWLAAACGLRRGEVLGLKWWDVDLAAGQLTVDHAYCMQPEGPRQGPAKNDSSRRTIKLSIATVQVLGQIRASQQAKYGFLPDHVCPSLLNAGPWHPNKFSGTFRDFLRANGMRPMRFHDLRHTHAAHLIAAGVHPKVISIRLGHRNINITMDLYGHIVPGIDDSSMRMWQRLFGDFDVE